METTGRFSPPTVRRWRVRPVCLTYPSMQSGQWAPRGVDTVRLFPADVPGPRPVLVPPGVKYVSRGPDTKKVGYKQEREAFSDHFVQMVEVIPTL